MRRVLAGDVASAARVLLLLPRSTRPLRLARLIATAEAADRHRRATGRPHPLWGTGSLTAAASGMPRAAEPDFDDDEYCRCWALALDALVRHRARHEGRSGRARGPRPG